MKSNSKDTYMAPLTSVDEFIYSDVLCASNNATNESFEQELPIEW